MTRFAKYCRKPAIDRRLLAVAVLLHIVVAIAICLVPFRRVREALAWAAARAPRRHPVADIEARIVRAVRTAASLLPGATCLTEALVAQCLLARYGCETMLCFGVSRERPVDRPFDAHAWLERGGVGLVGARGVVYEPLHHPVPWISSPSRR